MRLIILIYSVFFLFLESCSKTIIPVSDTSQKILGADISWLPELEDQQKVFSDNNKTADAMQILQNHGFNYIRLRIFVNPSNPNGYSPQKNYCDISQTIKMIKRAKMLGYKTLLDFHYSDTWADPAHQTIPLSWSNISTNALIDSIQNYTYQTLQTLKNQQCLPDMVQMGNEINNGILWKQGYIDSLNNLANLLKAGIKGVKLVQESMPIMLHIALGGNNGLSKYFLDNMINRGVQFDIIGQSYYPKWHGTIQDLKANLENLSKTYKQSIIIVEYSKLKKEVNEVAFSLPNNKYKGTFVWEPLNYWNDEAEPIFDENGKSNNLFQIYDQIKNTYLK
ncbi:MAG: glycosyl hydrolase 53 family protein [Sediminibacterium sp.]|nr:glycosyl hydrolase 53 family protein [Sediminibacterium sp.]